ncbi:hypothetical protein TNCV_4060751 [Trichonephila clavipes]|nr:hypothetical protein TNCV_4060751 [Trichonephila clavipes]
MTRRITVSLHPNLLTSTSSQCEDCEPRQIWHGSSSLHDGSLMAPGFIPITRQTSHVRDHDLSPTVTTH